MGINTYAEFLASDYWASLAAPRHFASHGAASRLFDGHEDRLAELARRAEEEKPLNDQRRKEPR
jgi:hypothetical protein